MKRVKKIAQPNYVRKLHYLWKVGAIPRDVGVHMLDVAHDDWCRHVHGESCNCDPDITVKWSQPAAAQN